MTHAANASFGTRHTSCTPGTRHLATSILYTSRVLMDMVDRAATVGSRFQSMCFVWDCVWTGGGGGGGGGGGKRQLEQDQSGNIRHVTIGKRRF